MNIHSKMKGKTIDKVMTDGKELIIFTTDSHNFRIGWEDGGPVLNSVNVDIVVTGVRSDGIAQIG